MVTQLPRNETNADDILNSMIDRPTSPSSASSFAPGDAFGIALSFAINTAQVLEQADIQNHAA